MSEKKFFTCPVCDRKLRPDLGGGYTITEWQKDFLRDEISGAPPLPLWCENTACMVMAVIIERATELSGDRWRDKERVLEEKQGSLDVLMEAGESESMSEKNSFMCPVCDRKLLPLGWEEGKELRTPVPPRYTRRKYEEELGPEQIVSDSLITSFSDSFKLLCTNTKCMVKAVKVERQTSTVNHNLIRHSGLSISPYYVDKDFILGIKWRALEMLYKIWS